jgi:RNA polymerase sigma factor (TIGR02999 family)
MTDATRILQALERGDPHAAEELLPLVYDELRQLAARQLAWENPGQTLDGTALVHEAYLRLIGSNPDQHWNGRGHFFAAAAEAMRRILVENARRKSRLRHGGDRKRLPMDRAQLADQATDDRILAVHEALGDLAKEDATAAEVVKLRYFVGLSIEQTADALGISVSTANRTWRFARAWLKEQLG